MRLPKFGLLYPEDEGTSSPRIVWSYLPTYITLEDLNLPVYRSVHPKPCHVLHFWVTFNNFTSLRETVGPYSNTHARHHSHTHTKIHGLSLSKRVLHRVLFHFPVCCLFLKSFNSCLRLLPRLPVTSILPSIPSSVTCFRRQFLRKMWPILVGLSLFYFM
jgi:hypothetical protein